MIVSVASNISHRCPFVDEVDHGRIEFWFDNDAPELHDLARYLDQCGELRITHEELTRAIAEAWRPRGVRTTSVRVWKSTSPGSWA